MSFVAPQRGIVTDRVGRNVGNMPNKTSIKPLMREIGRMLVKGNLNGKGPITSETDWETLLNKSGAYNKLFVVSTLMGEGADVANTSDNVRLSYSSTSHNTPLYNEFVQTIVRPAAPMRGGVIEDTTSMITMMREYDKVEPTCMTTLPEIAVDLINKARLNILNENNGYVSESTLSDPTLDAQRRETAMAALQQINAGFSGNVSKMQLALMASIPEQSQAAIEAESIPYELAQVTNELSASIVQNTAQGSIDPIGELRDANHTRSYYEEVASRSLENLFGVSKSVTKGTMGAFFSELMRTNRDFMTNLTTSDNTASGVVVMPADGQPQLPILGTLTVTEDMLPILKPLLARGRRVGAVPLDFHDTTDYYRQYGREMVRYKEEQNRIPTTGAALELLNVVDERNPNVDGSLNKIAPGGNEIFGRKDVDKERDFETNVEAVRSLPVNKDVIYITTQIGTDAEGAIVLNVKREDAMKRSYDLYSDKSASGLKTMHTLMRATVGDNDYKQIMPGAKIFADRMEKKDPGSINAIGKYGTKPVTAHTPDVSTIHHIFGPEEFKLAFLDPSLYDRVGLTERLNDFIKDAERGGSTMGELREMVSNIVTTWKNKVRYASEYYNSAGNNRAEELVSIELSPFFEVAPEGKSASRALFGDIPAWAHNINDHVLTAAMLTPSNYVDEGGLKKIVDDAVKAYKDLERKDTMELVSDPVGEEVKIPDAIGKLADELIKIGKEMYSGMANVDKCIKLDKEIVLSHVVFPMLGGFEFIAQKGAKQKFIVNKAKDGHLLWENNDGVETYMSFIFAGNAYTILNKMGITSTTTKGLSLLAMLRKTDPIGVAATIAKTYPFGLSADFYRLERMFCNEMILAPPKAIDVIVAPKPVKVTKMGDGSLNFVSSTQLNYVSNMSTATGLRVSNAFAKVRTDNIANMNAKPVIAMDFVTVSEYGNLDRMVDSIATANNIDTDEAKFIKSNLERYEEYRINDFGANQATRMTESYVPLIRPSRQLEPGLLPFLGMARHEALVGPSNGNGFTNFYGKLVTVNPFISNLGSVYQQRFHSSAQTISFDGTHMRFRTSNVNNEGTISETTKLFEEAMVFENLHLIDEQDRRSINKFITFRKGDDSKIIEATKDKLGRLDHREGNLMTRRHLLSTLGYSIPHTQYNSEDLLSIAKEKKKNVMAADGYFTILSPARKDYLGEPTPLFQYLR
ncbi:ORF104 [Ostreid herpesvirus 1]|nr:ORF104 [Ostreid herpesvirus 1]